MNKLPTEHYEHEIKRATAHMTAAEENKLRSLMAAGKAANEKSEVRLKVALAVFLFLVLMVLIN